ncbi:polynucleotide adenylyltransferase [Methylovirgula ligni]|uniref:Poly(A) polymerase n=1 Tax=Methylovirgula ligni TaxID=569860 RepID=A0A3D9YYI7_9HYPH|nr:CCA tRNA nucleotidyltransferase [Methylovirgula ligni]QAY94431.1 polynucleotide adenylyltransferase [Methylovirgula ligni]REF87717.1 poly(A) polymerase [Methylovirgula ligni]
MSSIAVEAPAAALALLKNQGLQRILALLDGDGEEARLVGGALRNALLDKPATEFDIATTATPEVVAARAQAADLRAVPTGLAHGTVTVIVDGHPFEVTSLREDVETDGRHAVVRFSRDFAADAQRRDFTMNALSLSRTGTLYDYVGGLADIAAKKLRFIGDPAERIKEDYLRILRFFRFSAGYAEGPLDTEGLLACIRARDGLARLSRERVRNELLKLLAAPRTGEVTREFSRSGLLGPLIASAPNPQRLERLLQFTQGEERDPILNLAALALNLPEDAHRLRDKLRLSNPEHQRLVRAAEALETLHGRDTPPAQQGLLKLLFLYGRRAACDALVLAAAEARDAAAEWRAALDVLRTAKEPRLPFSGDDLIARGIDAGKAVGDALRLLESRWIEAGYPEAPDRLAELLDEAVITIRKQGSAA